jgi:hypothetical protein
LREGAKEDIGLKREEITGWIELHSEVIKSRTAWAGHVARMKCNSYSFGGEIWNKETA